MVTNQDGSLSLGQAPRGLRALPSGDLRFQVIEASSEVTIVISSDRWEISGCGLGSLGDGTIVIHSVGGVRNPAGGRKEITEQKLPGSKVAVYYEDSSGVRRQVH